MARVFLSHASADKPVVRRIAVALRDAGHDTWLDEEQILVGESILRAVERGLSDADFVVVCLSKVAAERGWIDAERDAAVMQQFRERTERILPVRLDEVAPPHLIASFAYVDLFPDEDAFRQGMARLTRSIEAHEARHAGIARVSLRSSDQRGSSDPGAVSVPIASSTQPIAGLVPESRSTRRRAVAPTPVYPSAEVHALSERLEGARTRKQTLRDAGLATDDVDREILELRRQLRDGGQLRAGDALSDGRYLLIKPVGRGGFAVVWEAYDRNEQVRVAIKVLHTHLAGDPQRRERFLRGARVMKDLAHPAVVRVHDPAGQDDAFCYFVMELVSGGNLRDAVLSGRVDARQRLPIILQVGEALAEAHVRQLVHRDIKPTNILLDEHGRAKLTDFDLVGAHDTTGGTRTGALGTVVYAAPECLDKPQEATARADVFGLGMTAIFCLTGQDLSMATFRDPVATVARLDCSTTVRKVLQRAVAWEPERRFADAAGMVEALRGALGSAQSETMREERLVRTPPVFAAFELSSAAAGVPRVPQPPRWTALSGEDHHGPWAAFEINGVRQQLRWIPPGTFVMGSPKTERGRFGDEGPQHEVILTRGYWLGDTPVTQALWEAVMGRNPSRFRGDGPDDRERPVERVSWDDCQAFLERLDAQVTGLALGLPSEAEWERACRAGTTFATWVGELSGEEWAPELDAIAWYGGNSNRETHPVGRRAPNPYGLHDMLGNVHEWCADAGLRRYGAAPVTDPVVAGQGPDRVIRGGSWNGGARGVRAANRFAISRAVRFESVGFRLAGEQVSAPG